MFSIAHYATLREFPVFFIHSILLSVRCIEFKCLCCCWAMLSVVVGSVDFQQFQLPLSTAQHKKIKFQLTQNAIYSLKSDNKNSQFGMKRKKQLMTEMKKRACTVQVLGILERIWKRGLPCFFHSLLNRPRQWVPPVVNTQTCCLIVQIKACWK